MDNLPSTWTTLLVWGMAGVGVAARLVQYFFNRSLWWDEAMLALNILERSYRELLQPLDYYQGAPIGFLWGAKLLTQLFGTGEMALRLLPLLSGIVALALFAMVARRLLLNLPAAVVIGAFAFSDNLIFYSTEVKQYSSDVLVALVILLLSWRVLRDPLSKRRHWMLGVVGALLIWVSHPLVFVLAGTGVALLVRLLRHRLYPTRSQGTALAGMMLLWVTSFGMEYWQSLRHLRGERYLQAYWMDQGAFGPQRWAGLDGFGWAGGTFVEVFANPIGLGLPPLAAVIFVYGCIGLLAGPSRTQVDQSTHADRPVLLALLIVPVLVTLLAATLGYYPFKDRLILFLTPMMLLVIGFGLARLQQIAGRAGGWLVLIVAVLLLANPAQVAARALFEPRLGQEFRPALAYLDAHLQAGDTVYVYPRAQPQVLYYWGWRAEQMAPSPETGAPIWHNLQNDQNTIRYVVGVDRQGRWENHRADLDRLLGQQRVWIIFPTTFHLRDGVAYLAERGKLQSTQAFPGVEIFRFDLSNARAVDGGDLQ